MPYNTTRSAVPPMPCALWATLWEKLNYKEEFFSATLYVSCFPYDNASFGVVLRNWQGQSYKRADTDEQRNLFHYRKNKNELKPRFSCSARLCQN